MENTSTQGEPAVAVVGSYNVGMTMQVPDFPGPGETIIGHGFGEGPGGKGSNQAIAAARLGAASQFIGQLGDDQYGDDAVELWKHEGVDTSGVSRNNDSHTGVGFVIVDDNGENEITVAPGANDELSKEDVHIEADTIQSADVLLIQLEIGDEPVQAAVELAAEAGTTIICNPAPARELSASILEHVDYLTPNEHEARTLAGNGFNEKDDETVAQELLKLGADTVALTRGGAGALLVTADGIRSVQTPNIDVVDTTGAGDSFNGALAVALAEGQDDHDAIRFACAAGALAVTKSEVIPGLPNRKAVDRLVEETW